MLNFNNVTTTSLTTLSMVQTHMMKREKSNFAQNHLTWLIGGWRYPEQYKMVCMPAAGQEAVMMMLAIGVLLVVALAAFLAFFTQPSLQRQSTPWGPKHSSLDPIDMECQPSGIVMERA
jgi:hypothetical protein